MIQRGLMCALAAGMAFCQNSNPYLANSAWPIAHGNSWNTDSSVNAGPQSADADASMLLQLKLKHLALLDLLDPITILLTSDNKYVWASSISGVFKARMDAEKMELVGYLAHEVNLQFHGAYAFVDHDD